LHSNIPFLSVGITLDLLDHDLWTALCTGGSHSGCILWCNVDSVI
jgi:hypothetical protein